MHKRNHSLKLMRIGIMLILALIIEGQLIAQSCPMRCIDNINLSISENPNNPASCETEIGPGSLLGLNAFADLQACANAGGTNIQTQIKRFGAWTPALGTANATVSGSDVGKKFEVRVVIYNASGIVNSCWGTVKVEDKQAPRIVCPEDVLLFCNGPAIQAKAWETGAYCPTPTIIEAAMALYAGHGVADLSRSDASAINLSKTSQAISDVIASSKVLSRKSIDLF